MSARARLSRPLVSHDPVIGVPRLVQTCDTTLPLIEYTSSKREVENVGEDIACCLPHSCARQDSFISVTFSFMCQQAANEKSKTTLKSPPSTPTTAAAPAAPVGVYICICVCMYIYIYMYVWVCVCNYHCRHCVCINIYMYVCMYIYIYMSLFICIHMYVCLRVPPLCMDIYIYVCVYVYIYICEYVCMYTYVCVCA